MFKPTFVSKPANATVDDVSFQIPFDIQNGCRQVEPVLQQLEPFAGCCAFHIVFLILSFPLPVSNAPLSSPFQSYDIMPTIS
jgi:hypothetical protein